MDNLLVVSHSPHISGNDTVRKTMLDVIIALIPALLAGVLVFGYRAAVVTVISVLACVLFEWLWNKILNKPTTVGDFSAIVTGMLLAFNMPVTIPLWMVVIGAFFAIIIVKQFFGGLGHNFMNPALAARAFLLASWALAMTTWVAPHTAVPLWNTADVVTSATPLAAYAGTEGASQLPSYFNLFIGNVGGCIGEIKNPACISFDISSWNLDICRSGWIFYRRRFVSGSCRRRNAGSFLYGNGLYYYSIYSCRSNYFWYRLRSNNCFNQSVGRISGRLLILDSSYEYCYAFN